MSGVPKGFHTLTPHITVKGAAEAITFYTKAFGAKEVKRVEMQGMIGHAQLAIGDSTLMLNDEFPGQASAPPAEGGGVTLHLYVEDPDELFEQATKAGVAVVMPMMDTFWGDRYGVVKDPFGHCWSIGSQREELTPEEIAERAKQAFA